MTRLYKQVLGVVCFLCTLFYFDILTIPFKSTGGINPTESIIRKRLQLVEIAEEDTVPANSSDLQVVQARLELVQGSLCVDTDNNGDLAWEFCNPRRRQDFDLTTSGKLVFRKYGLCVGAHNLQDRSALSLVECGSRHVVLVKVRYFENIANIEEQETGLCVAAENQGPPHWWARIRYIIGYPLTVDWASRGQLVSLVSDESMCGIRFLEESWFQKDRAPLLLPLPEDSSCDFPACGINLARPPPAQLLSHNMTEKCTDLKLCVTIIVKTARRTAMVLRLVTSLRHTLGHDLAVVVADDGPEPHSPADMEHFTGFPDLRYVLGESELGIGAGRSLALSHVTTKYVLLVDDDFVFRGKDFMRMVEVLDTTDVSLVGGKTNRDTSYPGAFEFKRGPKAEALLSHYKNICKAPFSEPLPNFPSCFRCELTLNFFMARTAHLKKVGGWSAELKVCEHKDVFIRLKGHGMKVAYCPTILVNHDGLKNSGYDNKRKSYLQLRSGRTENYVESIHNIWNIETENVGQRDTFTWE